MNKFALIGLLVWVLSVTVRGGEEATADVAKSLEQIAVDAKSVLAQKNILDVFDWYRKMKDYGLTYQPSLTAPNDLVEKLNDEQLRFYAGIKLFDAIYAVSFLKRQEVADCVSVIEEIQKRLNLRSYADLNNFFLQTLKAVAEDPSAVDVQELIVQLASDYVNELPELLSSPETADYLIDGLYGTILQQYCMIESLAPLCGDPLEEAFELYPSQSFYTMLLDLFKAFDRMDEEIRVSGETVEKLEVIREMYRIDQLDESNGISEEEADALWGALTSRARAILMSIQTPGSM